MWGSYYSSSYAHTGTMSMRYEYGSIVANDWLFTPGVALTAVQPIHLIGGIDVIQPLTMNV